MARIVCPSCSSENTWAQYVHSPCPNSPTGKTAWEAPAEGATPTVKPSPSPCPTPLDGPMTQASDVTCQDCSHQW